VIPDVNITVASFRPDHTHHDPMRRWLQAASIGPEPLGILDLVLSSMVRITTNPNFMGSAASLADALAFAEALRAAPSAVVVRPGPRHWPIFRELCLATGARGNRIPDAYLAAIAIEADAVFVTADRGFEMFPGLRSLDPLGD